MKVFVSWSGARSRAVAELLCDWIKCVIQATRPWISTRDIDRGALWFSEINDQLMDTTVGIVCITQENKNKPWILFEAGALAKGLTSNRVCTFLVDLKPSDIEDPLAQFNHTLPDREGVWDLIRTLNNSLGDDGLDEKILSQVFDTYWGQFESKFKVIIKQPYESEKTEARTEKNLLAEILENTRFLSQRIRTLEQRIDSSSPFRSHDGLSEQQSNSLLPLNLSVRQLEVLKLLFEGKSNREIAEELKLAEGTVRIHIAALYQIFKVTSRLELARLYESLVKHRN